MTLPYEPNTTTWKTGDIVLHMYDEKHPKMFMKVIGYTRDGLCKTQYVERDKKRTVWKNEIQFLLDVARFGFHGNEDPTEYERVRRWNFYNKVGQPVRLFGEEIYETKTRSEAWLTPSNMAVVLVEGRVGGYWLEHVQAVRV